MIKVVLQESILKVAFIAFFPFSFLQTAFDSNAQVKERPFIWVTKGDRKDILKKIDQQPWAGSYYKQFKERLDKDLKRYASSPIAFLKKLPFDSSQQKSNSIPPFRQFLSYTDENKETGLKAYLAIAIDCSILYFLTEEKKYGQCGLDILYSVMEGLAQIKPSENAANGGWIYPNEHLREARVFGAQIPIIYDFIAPFIAKGERPYDFAKGKKVTFSFDKAQLVFSTYANLAIGHGHTGSNWSILEAPSLVHNALALDNELERTKYLNYFLIEGTKYQDALPEVVKRYPQDGAVFPETSQYSNGVASLTSKLLYILIRYDPTLQLGQKYDRIPFALDRWDSFRYPNGEIVRFGDGHRHFDVSYLDYEIASLIGKVGNVPKLSKKFDPLIAHAIKTGKYSRSDLGKRGDGAAVYYDPLKLLWVSGSDSNGEGHPNLALPRTDNLPHAGLFLQRNFSGTEKPEDALMCFVAGAHYVHGHAGGMNIELYGQGMVMGVDNGRGAYQTDLHENYSRLFAAHNTVIVNGASQGEGDWVNLGINTVEKIAMEPEPYHEALSPYHSFTLTSFRDNRGDKAEALQERMLALIRTSPTTGYYIDVFRSKSSLPNEFHDYIYHNIGDQLVFLNTDLALQQDPQRYLSSANGEWKQNRLYRNPGWHFFKEVESSPVYEKNIIARFNIEKRGGQKSEMNVYVAGTKDREYSKVMAPQTFEAPAPYNQLPTPTLVIRKKGEAWNNPFALVFEPKSKQTNNGIVQVEKLEQQQQFKGFEIVSKIEERLVRQFVITQDANHVFKDETRNIYFEGSLAVATVNEKNELQSVYVGDGKELLFNGYRIKSKDLKKCSFYIDYSSPDLMVKTDGKITIEYQGQVKEY
jgi:Heparinase II/III-like protein